MTWVELMVDQFGLRDAPQVLDVGSLNVNGSTRGLFAGVVTGIDIRPGPEVDVIVAAADLRTHACGTFAVVTCTEMLEHDPTPWLTIEGAAHVLRPGGMLLLTARGVSSAHCPITDRPHAFGAHGEPDDWWRYMPGTLGMLCRLNGLEPVDEREDPQAPGWFCAAVKPAAL